MPSQRERLQILHAYEWVDENPDRASRNLDILFNAIETAEELWYASFIIPWDPNDGGFNRILDHKLCDRGIALFLYWALDPAGFYRCVHPRAFPGGQLLAEIERRFSEGAYPDEKIAFSPTESPNYSADHNRIPSQMLVATGGAVVERDYRGPVFVNDFNGG